jgi:ferric-dicitrate binding protein FerR (iron transport regulator)
VATKKQKRRRAKENRHEYVWEDAEGNELDPEDVPARKAGAEPSARSSAPREVQAPSWRRTLKRGLIFAPIMLGTVMLLSSGDTIAQQVTQTAVIVAIFIPFSYVLDNVFYRAHLRRVERQRGVSGRES